MGVQCLFRIITVSTQKSTLAQCNLKLCFQKSRPSSSTQKHSKNHPIISFGTTLDRSLFPHNCAPDRTGNELTPLKGAPHRGPGVYNNDEITSSIYQAQNQTFHPCSTTGCYLNRTMRRFFKIKTDQTPAANKYQRDNTEVVKFEPAYKPFMSAVQRFQEPLIDPMITPGPGSYYVHVLRRNRKISWPQQFGGRIDDRAREMIHAKDARTIFRTHQNEVKRRMKRENKLAYFKLYFDDE